jgi:hypothetical protein
VVVDMGLLLLYMHGMGGGTPYWLLRARHAYARRLSSYNNNSPRCGADRLRDAW